MKRMLFAAILVCVAVTVGCQATPVKHYLLQAEVISADAPRKLITVKHGEVPGLMPAMTMTYAVADAKQIENLHAGDKITADLVGGENVGHLEKIALESQPNTSSKSR
jgi:protein SCO1/2